MAEPLSADQIASRDFPTSFRGFDQHEVRAFLGQVAAALGAAEQRERALQARVAELEAVPAAPLDEAAIEQALGQEATRIIHAAREAAAEIRERAESNAAKILQEANERNATARADAEAMAAVMRAEVDEALAVLRADTEQRATSIIDEAERTRDKVLKDLARRRKQALAQLEQLHTARSMLEAAYEKVRAALDAATAEVAVADDEAVTIASAAMASAAPPAVAVAESPDAPEPPADPADVAVEPVVEPEPEVVEVVEPPAEPVAVEPEPEPAPAPPVDDRRSSSLRLLRREQPSTPVAPPAEGEGVRIIRPEAPELRPVADDPEPAPEPAPAPEPEAEPEPEPEPETEVAVAEHAPVDDLFARLRADRAEKTAAAVAVLAEPIVQVVPDPEPEPVVVAEAEPSGDAALLAARDAAIGDIERALVRSVKRALADEQNEVLDALRRLKGKPSVEAIMPDTAVHDARYEAVLSTAAAQAAAAGGTGTAGDVVRQRGASVALDLRTRVGRVVDEAGGDVDTLIEAISATYREWKTARAEPLARDVVTAAYASGAYEAAEGSLRWVVDPAEGGCPDCDDNALAGPTPKGTVFPTGQLHPPAHAGCRCTVVADTP